MVFSGWNPHRKIKKSLGNAGTVRYLQFNGPDKSVRRIGNGFVEDSKMSRTSLAIFYSAGAASLLGACGLALVCTAPTFYEEEYVAARYSVVQAVFSEGEASLTGPPAPPAVDPFDPPATHNGSTSTHQANTDNHFSPSDTHATSTTTHLSITANHSTNSLTHGTSSDYHQPTTDSYGYEGLHTWDRHRVDSRLHELDSSYHMATVNIHTSRTDTHHVGSNFHDYRSTTHMANTDVHGSDTTTHRVNTDVHAQSSNTHKPNSNTHRPNSQTHKPNSALTPIPIDPEKN